MTYGVCQVTFSGYLAMLPDLTEEQKKHIMFFLVEAREIAMDAGSSREKHQWFGKYKGKINNYLSAAGYDLKKASKEWNNRRKTAGYDQEKSLKEWYKLRKAAHYKLKNTSKEGNKQQKAASNDNTQ